MVPEERAPASVSNGWFLRSERQRASRRTTRPQAAGSGNENLALRQAQGPPFDKLRDHPSTSSGTTLRQAQGPPFDKLRDLRFLRSERQRASRRTTSSGNPRLEGRQAQGTVNTRPRSYLPVDYLPLSLPASEPPGRCSPAGAPANYRPATTPRRRPHGPLAPSPIPRPSVHGPRSVPAAPSCNSPGPRR